MSKSYAPPPIEIPKHKGLLRKMKAELAADKKLISKRDVKTRILRALKTLDVQPDPDWKFFRIKSSMPDYIRDPLSPKDELWVRNEELSKPKRFIAEPEDIERYLDDLSWLNPLTQSERDIITWRARDYAYRDIAQWWDITERQAENEFKGALSNCWFVAALSQRNANKEAH